MCKTTQIEQVRNLQLLLRKAVVFSTIFLKCTNPDATIYTAYPQQVFKPSKNTGILDPKLKSMADGKYSFENCVLVYFSDQLIKDLNQENIPYPQPEGFILIQKIIPLSNLIS